MKIIYLCICLLFVYLFSTPLQNIILNEKEISYLETKKIITMCINPNWQPFEKINKDDIHEVISADLIFIIFIILLWNYLLNKRVKIELKKNKEQQLKLIEQKRKAQIGELLGNISHQWRNGLTQISSLNLEMILMYKLNQNLNNNKEFYQRLEDTENAIKFMVETMDTFLQYYKEEKKYITFRIKENIEQVMRLIDIEIKNSNLKIEIINNFDLKISANSNEWMHIWLNLITNTIKASKTHNIIPKVKIVINENNIIYTDNCKGLEEKILKEIKNGIQDGLGLRMTKKILEKNNLLFNIENFNNGIKIIFYKGVI